MMRRRNTFLGLLLMALLVVGSVPAVRALAAPQDDQQSSTKAKDEKKTDEKKKDEKESTGKEHKPLDTRKVLSRILRDFTNGLEGLSPSVLRQVIDDRKFYNYPRFEQGVDDFLRSVGEMRLYTREVNVEINGDHAVMIVDAEMALSARQDPSRRDRRRATITFDFQRTAEEGWKITEINPRSFFLP